MGHHRAKTSMSDIGARNAESQRYSYPFNRLESSSPKHEVDRYSSDSETLSQDRKTLLYSGSGFIGTSSKPSFSFNTEWFLLTWQKKRLWFISLGIILAILAVSTWEASSSHGYWALSDEAPDHPSSASGFSQPRDVVTFLNGSRFERPPELKIVATVFCKDNGQAQQLLAHLQNGTILILYRWTSAIPADPRLLSPP